MTKKSIHKKEGQVLLIVIMLLATVITVVTTISFRSTTETQTSKLTEDSERTLAAAEAGIERAISQKIDAGNNLPFNDTTNPSLKFDTNTLSGIDLSGSNVKVTSNNGDEFVSPIVQKDQQYTFYLASFDSTASPPFSGNYTNNINIYYGSESPCDAVALEITVISNNIEPHTMSRYIADSTGGILTNPPGNTLTNNLFDSSYTSAKMAGTTFNCKTTVVPKNATSILVLIRSLGNRTKIGVKGSSAAPSLPNQGKYIVSEAKSQSGVVKKIQLFQSLPQIPAEFFVSTL